MGSLAPAIALSNYDYEHVTKSCTSDSSIDRLFFIVPLRHFPYLTELLSPRLAGAVGARNYVGAQYDQDFNPGSRDLKLSPSH